MAFNTKIAATTYLIAGLLLTICQSSSSQESNIDTDLDGIPDEVEQSYDFLDENNPDDAIIDHDGDGTSTVYEINSGYRPDIADNHETLDLSPYFPLGTISYQYVDQLGNVVTTKTIAPTDDSGEYKLDIENTNTRHSEIIERLDGAIYLVDFADYKHSGCMIFPNELQLGHAIGSICSHTDYFYPEEGRVSYLLKYALVETGKIDWNGQTYDSIVIENVSGRRTTYLKGIGEYSNDTYTLQTLEISDISTDREVETNQTPAINSTGGGLFDFFVLLVLQFIFFQKKILKRRHG